ncbi:MAG TPA: PsbP-related protein [Nitrososphaeraceae archaeon]
MPFTSPMKLNKPVQELSTVKMQKHKVTVSQFFVHCSCLHTSYSTNLVMCFLFSAFVSYTSVSQLAVAQQISSSESSETIIKRLLSEAIEKLDSGNSSKTVQNLLTVQRLIVQNNVNSTSTHDSMLLIRETVAAILNGRSDIAKTNLGLLNKQLNAQPQANATSTTTPFVKTIPSNQFSNQSTELINETKTVDNETSTGFQTYQNHILGIKIRYPDSWYVRTYPYNNAANDTVVGFYSPSNTASELGNISGVSGHFVPYVDIFVFDSKNMSLDKIIKGRINRIQNTSDFVLDSKPFTLRGNHSAHMLVYSTTTGGDESFRKMQVYTISDNKVYLITFTSQEALFSNYLPTVLKMIDSFNI